MSSTPRADGKDRNIPGARAYSTRPLRAATALQRRYESFGSVLKLSHSLVQLSALTRPFLQNGARRNMRTDDTRFWNGDFVCENVRKVDVHKKNSINPYAEENNLTSTLYKKLNSTAKIYFKDKIHQK